MEWCIYNLNNQSDTDYLEYYRIYKLLITTCKNLDYYIRINPYKFIGLTKFLRNKNHLLIELPLNTILHPYSYCPRNNLHNVLEIKIRHNTIVCQCGYCNSIVIPRICF